MEELARGGDTGRAQTAVCACRSLHGICMAHVEEEKETNMHEHGYALGFSFSMHQRHAVSMIYPSHTQCKLNTCM